MYTPNLFGAMLLPVTQKLGSNIPRLALMALVEIHSSRFVALLRMTLVRCVGEGDRSGVVCFTLDGLFSIVKDRYSVSGYDTVSSSVFKMRE